MSGGRAALYVLAAFLFIYLGSFVCLAREFGGTRNVGAKGVTSSGGRVGADGQWLPYDQRWLYVSLNPARNRCAYCAYYPIHKTLAWVGWATFVRDTSIFF